MFAEQFKSVFNNASAPAPQIIDASLVAPLHAFSFEMPLITASTVASALHDLKLSYSAGPDGIPSSVLKKCSEILSIPLAKLFNLSIAQSKFPEKWKFSYLFPVHKKGDKRNVCNYRGITSLSACSKLFEIIVNRALFASCKNYIDADQHGFYPKRSVSTNLVQFSSFCLQGMDSGAQIDAIYLDLKAAFDRVDHGILLGKMERLGVSSDAICWFKSYLTCRSVRIKIGSSVSNSFSNGSGVPQGSNLGPLLFSIFINDISLLLPSGCRLFYADDTKIYSIIKCRSDCLMLQSLLDVFVDWCSMNGLTLSVEKCSTISYHRKRSPIVFDYAISGQFLQRVHSIKDLGVTMDAGLTFKAHYSDIIARANRQLGFIFKVADEFLDPLCLKSLYCSLVRSILETNTVVWSPFHVTWSNRIEAVQKKFVRYALRNLPWQDPLNLPAYENRCRLLGIEPLDLRRKVSQAVFAAKLLFNDIDCPALLSRLNIYAPERLLRQRDFLYLEPRNRSYGAHEPVRAISQQFNESFEQFDFDISANVFRQRLLHVFRNINR